MRKANIVGLILIAVIGGMTLCSRLLEKAELSSRCRSAYQARFGASEPACEKICGLYQDLRRRSKAELEREARSLIILGACLADDLNGRCAECRERIQSKP